MVYGMLKTSLLKPLPKIKLKPDIFFSFNYFLIKPKTFQHHLRYRLRINFSHFTSVSPPQYWQTPLEYKANTSSHECCSGFCHKQAFMGLVIHTTSRESVIFFLDWLPAQAREPSLPYYLNGRGNELSFPKDICAKVNAITSAGI